GAGSRRVLRSARRIEPLERQPGHDGQHDSADPTDGPYGAKRHVHAHPEHQVAEHDVRPALGDGFRHAEPVDGADHEHASFRPPEPLVEASDGVALETVLEARPADDRGGPRCRGDADRVADVVAPGAQAHVQVGAAQAYRVDVAIELRDEPPRRAQVTVRADAPETHACAEQVDALVDVALLGADRDADDGPLASFSHEGARLPRCGFYSCAVLRPTTWSTSPGEASRRSRTRSQGAPRSSAPVGSRRRCWRAAAALCR